MNNGKMVVSRGASKARRNIKKGRNCGYYGEIKLRAHRRDRRNAKQALRQGKEPTLIRVMDRDVD